VDHDLAEQWKGWFEPVPDPLGKSFTGGIFETGDVVQIVVINLIEDRRERRLDVGEVHDPAGVNADRSGYMDFYAEGMPVQARALVSWRHVGQPVCGLDVKNLEDVHVRIVHTGKFVRRWLPEIPAPRIKPVEQRRVVQHASGHKVLHAVVAFDHAVDGKQARFTEHAPELACDIAPDDGIGHSGLVFQGDEGDAARVGRLLAKKNRPA